MKNIFIVSARRSGTHLLTDMIVNNFGYERISNNIDFDKLAESNYDEFIECMESGNKIAWTHNDDYLDIIKSYPNQILEIFKNSTIIFVYRDIRDVMMSIYNRKENESRYKDFQDFYDNFDLLGYESLIKYGHGDLFNSLLEYYKNWFSLYFSRELVGVDLNVIAFEDIINSYDKSLNRISDFLELPLLDNLDVRLKSLDEVNPNIKYTYNEFNGCNIGNWDGRDLFKELKYEYDAIIGNHINPFLKNNKLHKFHDPERKYFQIDSRDWDKVDDEINQKLALLSLDYEYPNEKDLYIINNRYKDSYRIDNDIRYGHKVFIHEKYVLKFLFPCKAVLDKKTFKHVNRVASKVNMYTILKTNEILQSNGIAPELLGIGIYNDILYVIQERVSSDDLVNNKFNIGPISTSGWTWMIEHKIYPMILDLFFDMLQENLLLTDLISPYNLGLVDGQLKYFDLDGMKLFDSKNELHNSLEFYNVYNTLLEIDELWLIKYGYSEMDKKILK